MWMEYDRCLQKIEDWTEAMEEDAIIIGHDAHSPKELERKLPAGFEGNKSLQGNNRLSWKSQEEKQKNAEKP